MTHVIILIYTCQKLISTLSEEASYLKALTGSFHQTHARHLNISYVINLYLHIKIENIFHALLTIWDCTYVLFFHYLFLCQFACLIVSPVRSTYGGYYGLVVVPPPRPPRPQTLHRSHDNLNPYRIASIFYM